jgi:hypothetical protein
MTLQEKQNKFQVGEVVFFIASKSERVVPALVAEKIVRTSIDEKLKVSYILRIQVNDKPKEVEVDPEKYTLYSTPEDVRDYMIKRTAETIDQMIAQAVKDASVFGPPKKRATTTRTSTDSLPVPTPDMGTLKEFVEMGKVGEGEEVMVELGDGNVARLRMPQ